MSEKDDDWYDSATAESDDEDWPDERGSDDDSPSPDDDWFDEATADEDDATADAADGADGSTPDDATADADLDADDGGSTDGATDPGRGPGGDTDVTGSDASVDPDGEDGPAGDDGDGPAGPDDPADAGDENLFEEDFASELDGVNAPDPTGGDEDFGANDPGGQDEFGGGTPPGGGEIGMGTTGGPDRNAPGGGGGDFGMGGGETGMGGGDFGMGGGDFGMGGAEEFDEEEFESDIDRIDLGIEGLDEMIQGGVPRRSLMVAIGSAGTGKTTLGIQFLHEELRKSDGGNAVFITLEESADRVVNSAVEKGYPFEEYVDEGRLAIVDMDPIEMANSLATIRSELPRLITEFNAERLVLDSVSLLEMMYDSRANRRNEIYDFTKSLKAAGVTTMLTSEANASDPYTSRYGIVEYLTDAVFILQYVRPSDFRKTRLAVEIQKIRDANHSRETKPYEITNSGISVYRQANIF